MKKSSKEAEYWFRAKRYGWGWGLPATRKGWTVFGVFIAVWLLALLFVISGESIEISNQRMSVFLGAVVLDVLFLLYFSIKYGEPPKWRWGKTLPKTSSTDSKSPTFGKNLPGTRQRKQGYASSSQTSFSSKLDNLAQAERSREESKK